MKFRDKIFPYPVIKHYEDDYKAAVFRVDAIYAQHDDKLVITFELLLTDEYLLRLLDKNKISFLIHLEESRTMYRKSFKFNKLTKTVTIPLNKVKSRIEVVSFLVTNETIENFTSDNFSDWYKGINFNLNENLIIGFGDLFDIHVQKEDDEFKSV